MQILYDEEADAVSLWYGDTISEKTIDISEDIFIDLDKDCRLIGIEILHISEKPDLADILNVFAGFDAFEVTMDKFRPDFHLYVITDQNLSKGRSNEEVVEKAIAGRADVIQFRDKEHNMRWLLQEAFKLKDIAKKNGVLFIINDRVDLAMAVDADGVHLGQDDMPLKYARKLLGKDKIIGISANNVEQAIQAEKDGADYVAVSAIFSTPTKPDAPSLGLKSITDIKENVKIPVVAIGGIKHENVAQVGKAGADCIAVISAVVSAENIKEAARELRDKFLASKDKSEVKSGDAVRSS
jgi:thiamine-phosphate pyrophosphorylase